MDKAKAPVNGFLNLYKVSGPTSMGVLRQVKNLTGQKKRVGHGGTLDPLAEGVLPICFGQATRLMEHLVESEKQYRMEVHLGVTTSTYDGEGEVTKRGDASGLDRDDIEEAIKPFLGSIYQTPPMYSAIKRDGKRLYELAREGVEVERQPRKVEIPRIEILEFDPPSLVLDVDSGRGAYMRSLAHDLGEALGCGGYLRNLVRLRSGKFTAEDAIPIEKIQENDGTEHWKEYLHPVDFVLLSMKGVSVSKAAERYIRSGRPVSLPPHIGAYAGYMERYRAYTTDGRLLAIICYNKPINQWQPYKVFSLDTPSPYAPGNGGDGFRPPYLSADRQV